MLKFQGPWMRKVHITTKITFYTRNTQVIPLIVYSFTGQVKVKSKILNFTKILNYTRIVIHTETIKY